MKRQREMLSHARDATVAFVLTPPEQHSSESHDPGQLPKIVGSGVAIKDNPRVIVTARHVLSGAMAEITRLRLDRGIDYRLGILSVGGFSRFDTGSESGLTMGYNVSWGDFQVRRSIEHDIGVLKIPADSKGPSVGMPLGDPKSVREGDLVMTCGWPYGTEIHDGGLPISSFLWGRISMIEPHPEMDPEGRGTYWTQMPVNPGNSGGGVFSHESGHLIGVVRGRLEAKGVATGLSTVVPLTHAHQVIGSLLAEIEGGGDDQ